MSNLAFEIGYDHYRFRFPLEIDRFQNYYRADIRNGFEAAKYQQVSRRTPDMYERKLLCIRDRALIKGLEASITTKDLCREYEKTHGICPVTGVPFSFADNSDTDWSVDRINNNRGYSSDNIVVVSVIVNQVKSDLDLTGMIKASLTIKHSKNQAFQPKLQFKIAQFYFKRMQLLKPLSFCQLLKKTQSLFDQLVFIQFFLNKDRNSRAFINQLEKYVDKKAIKKAEKLVLKRVHHRADIGVDVLYDSPKLYSSIQSFIKVINQHSKEFDPLLMNCLFA